MVLATHINYAHPFPLCSPGVPGTTGDMGEKGEPGTSADGLKGDRGDDGRDGLDGNPGEKQILSCCKTKARRCPFFALNGYNSIVKR